MAHPKGFERENMFLVQHLRDWVTRRRLTATLLLVTSLLMVFPISLRVVTPDTELNAAGKDASEPFPCQNRTCGCKSAKQCWKKCCCFSNAQKIAWAKANRVKPPAFVVAAAKQEASVVKGSTSRTKMCCSTKVSTKSVPNAPRAKARVRLVVGIDAMQCQGVEQTVSGQLISLQPPAPMTLLITNLDRGEFVQLPNSPLTPSEQEPPTPPPRLRAA